MDQIEEQVSLVEITEPRAGGSDSEPVIWYSSEEIRSYRNSPLALQPPGVETNLSCWKTYKLDDDLIKRREKNRREGDGIVLSPQLGSAFKQGCSVTITQQQGQSHGQGHGQGHTGFPQRRIGSGRLNNLVEWDPDDREEDGPIRRKKYNSQSEDIRSRSDKQKLSGMIRNDLDNRGNGRGDYGRASNGYGSGYHQNRSDHNRNRSNGYDRRTSGDTPEWFLDGPTSRDDHIELHGFDGPEPENAKKSPAKSPTITDQMENLAVNGDAPVLLADVEANMRSKVDSEPITAAPGSRLHQYLQAQATSTPIQAAPELECTVGQVGTGTGPPARELFTAQRFQGPLSNHPKVSQDKGNDTEEGDVGSGTTATAFISSMGNQAPAGAKLTLLAQTMKMHSLDELEAQVLRSQPGPAMMEESHMQNNHNMVRRPQMGDPATPAHVQIQMLQQLEMAQRQQQQFMFGVTSIPYSLQYMIVQATPTPDIVCGQDYHSLLTAVKQGSITPQKIVNLLLSGSAIPQRQHKVLLTVLNLVLTSQRAGSPIFGRDLPVKHPVNPAMNDLVAHTASIMQTALIKRKLEEQMENYKRRQDVSKAVPNVGGGQVPGMAPPPLAFTPTAVMRKMTLGQTPAEVQRSQAGSPNLYTDSPGRPSSPVGAFHLMNPGFNGAPRSPPSGLAPSHSAAQVSHYGGAPLQIVPNFRQQMGYTPQAFIGQFAQPMVHGGNMGADPGWWTPEAMTRGAPLRQVVPPMGAPGHMGNPMMTVEELERAQQRASDYIIGQQRRVAQRKI